MSNCSVDNRTYTAVLVSCQPGYDGGVAQQFVLEIIPSAFFPTLDIQNKIKSIHYPQFRIENLPAGTEYMVVVYAKLKRELVKRQRPDFGLCGLQQRSVKSAYSLPQMMGLYL